MHNFLRYLIFNILNHKVPQEIEHLGGGHFARLELITLTGLVEVKANKVGSTQLLRKYFDALPLIEIPALQTVGTTSVLDGSIT